ncbi:E3 ubiquitin-protein ligase UPL4 isoform X1 [Coffea eugenioides]|uniref:E3 ubiquitin-protein ligase UPL4 isoform X1 n=1 Tax=Coffea eugenioides TaxID=49369 RepID=UPI000F60DEF6|nr:E3 ubiquitin-protein ligase UPL4 isoform X1 [Coffea eugenioides]XP_027173821.1 E3 ubiquitin-protein ligase UPL4 isoform X1 [Coffea eugenioides]
MQMGNRGHKRAETADELPADKRACTLSEFRPSTSNSSIQTPTNSTHETHDADMDSSSATSGSARSDGEGERDSAYGSCDSDNNYRDYYRRGSSGDQTKFNRVLSSLNEDHDESGQLAALTELCELLSFCTDNSLSGLMADSFSPVLVKLARHESNPNIMLLAIRAITYFCDVHPRSSAYLVRHDAVPALCQRLLAIEYLDVAEQCLQALEKISREQPLACLQSGAIMAVLNYIDFFSTIVQRVALSTVVNICKKLPSECPSPFMDAVPILCKLLQYEDRQLVESVSTCLIKITERVCHSSDMLDDLCKHGLVQQATDLINLNSRTSLSPPIYLGLIGLLARLASGSIVAVRTLFEINVSSILQDIVSRYDLAHGMPFNAMVDGQCNQVHEVLKLLNELLPATTREQDNPLASDKEAFLTSRPDLMQRFGLDLLPVLIRVVNSGVNLYVCYGCLSVINKLVYFSKSDMLLDFLQSTNISSFLAGVFTRKDHHVLLLALQVVETLLQKLPDGLLDSFIKEGVCFAVDSLLSPKRSSQFMFSTLSAMEYSDDASQKSASRDARCLCFAFDTGQCPTISRTLTCKLDKDSIRNLAEHIKTSYFATEAINPEKGLTDILQKLKTLSSVLADLVNTHMNDTISEQHEEEFYCILLEIMSVLAGKDPISTFEFVESGIAKSLLNYLSNGQYMERKAGVDGACCQLCIVEKRFELLGNLLLSFRDPHIADFPLPALVRRLQSSLASLETFPVILSHSSRVRSSYATVPHGRGTSYPCLKVQFVKGEEDVFLGDYLKDVVNVDPFSTLTAIDGYMWSKVSVNKSEQAKSATLEESSSFRSRSLDSVESNSMLSHANEMQEERSFSGTGEIASVGDNLVNSADLKDLDNETVEQEQEGSVNKSTDSHGCSKNEDSSPKLFFNLEGQQLDHRLTLYQAIIQQQLKEEIDSSLSSKLWSQVYKISYRKAVNPKNNLAEQCSFQGHDFSSSDKATRSCQCVSFFSDIFYSDFADLNKFSPTYDMICLLKSLEGMNRLRYHVMSRDRMNSFLKCQIDNLYDWKVEAFGVSQSEFVNSKLTEKLEQQMRDPLAVSVGGMPSWCSQLMASCPFLFGFEARCKYFRLAAFGQPAVRHHVSYNDDVGGINGMRQNSGSYPRKKFLVHRNRILDSAAQMMNLHAHQRVVLEVEYNDEVGTGLGPTLEFYTLVSYEFQKGGLCLWREDHAASSCINGSEADNSKILVSPLGLFPRPWLPGVDISNGIQFSEVTKKFVLLGQIVGKALQDGRVLDLPFSKAFYKLILGKELTVYDIQSFDVELGRVLLEFQALIERKRYLESISPGKSSMDLDFFHGTRIEDLCLDFSLPGYPDYVPESVSDSKMVKMSNLQEYISFVVDATIRTGISRQVEAFKSGFDQVFPIRHLQVFTEGELERLLCGERELWDSNALVDHIKFDHGYTASSPPILNFLQIIQEFNYEQQRSFLRFVTGAPRLPSGGLASLNPKLTIVRKHCSKWVDTDLPSVMTCANYLKLPPYSSKERMKEKLLYAITEGQGSFHLS